LKKTILHYELYGSAKAGENGYWRWAIFSPVAKRPLLVGTFDGPLADAKKHAEAAILRLKERDRPPQKPAENSSWIKPLPR